MHRSALLSLALLAAVAAPAGAQGPIGNLGVGVESPLGLGPLIDGPRYLAFPGLSLRAQLTERFGLQLITAVRSVAARNDSAIPNARTTFGGLFLRAHITVIEAGNLHLGAFGGFGFAGGRRVQDSLVYAYRGLGFEGGLRPELFLADGRISLHFQLGVSFAVTLVDRSGPGAAFFNEGFGFGFGRNSDLFGNAGLTVWFGSGGRQSPPPPPARQQTQPAPEPPPSWETGEPAVDDWSAPQ
ncbi:MAG: hypothetical protein KF901_06535 [Myxococcales bacterium]|nr:hypothetical protein [Myxococcales bacterium]